MKSYIDHYGNKVPGISILESIIPNQRKLNNLVKVLSAFNLAIDPSVQVSNKKRTWVK